MFFPFLFGLFLSSSCLACLNVEILNSTAMVQEARPLGGDYVTWVGLMSGISAFLPST